MSWTHELETGTEILSRLGDDFFHFEKSSCFSPSVIMLRTTPILLIVGHASASKAFVHSPNLSVKGLHLYVDLAGIGIDFFFLE